MQDKQFEQLLAAIHAADGVGYSRLMADDERGTVIALDTARAVFRRQIDLHGGRAIDMPGDFVLALFGTATGAVTAALEVQKEIAALAEQNAESRRMLFRIGVHLGDVIVKPDGTIYGDGVNIAARLQALAQPGGITVSDAVRGAVRGKVAIRFVDQGEQAVKNISERIRAYHLREEGAEGGAPTAGNETSEPLAPTSGATETFSVKLPVMGFDGRPAIAVLPFDNMSNDPEQAYFADGIAEDILTRLSMWRWLPVIARNSSFVYRGKAVDVKQVGAALGARYVLEGSVRKSGNRVRVTGQLIDSETGHHVWAERYDRVLEEIFALQDEITDAIMAALQPVVGAAERTRARHKPPQDLGAWDLYQRGSWYFGQLTRDAFAEAKSLYLRAAQADPQFAPPLASAATIELISSIFGWSDAKNAAGECYRLACEAMQRDPTDPLALAAHGMGSAQVGLLDAALLSAQKSVEINPSSVNGHSALGYAALLNGQFETAGFTYEKALRLSPNDYSSPILLGSLAASYYHRRNYEKASEIAALGVQRAPAFPMCHGILARSLSQLGREAEARIALAKLLELSPEYSSEGLRRALPFRDPAHTEHWIEGLRKLGWTG